MKPVNCTLSPTAARPTVIWIGKTVPSARRATPCCGPISARLLNRSAFTAASPDTDLSRSEEHTSELQSLMRISYAVFCLKKKILLQSTSNNHSEEIMLY